MRGIVILFVAFCVVDGANIMEKITGTDAGLSTMAGKLIAGMHMIRGAAIAGQQMRQMGMLKRQTRAMETMASTGDGNPIAGESGQGSRNMQDSGESGNGDEGRKAGDSGGSSSEQDNTQNQSGSSEHSQEGTAESDRGNYEGMDYSGGTESEGASAANHNFSQMDDALDNQGGMESSESMEHTGPDMGSGNGEAEKGMFDRWAEKADGTRPQEDSEGKDSSSQTSAERSRSRYAERNQTQPMQNSNGSRTTGQYAERNSRKMATNTSTKYKQNTDSKKEKE